ncbi:ABC transporter permease [Niabella aurantiaca]|uniref:ABC transporter permease n=1 Tax=Niabella aurantiaca TaxID=379900 RepID=UPI000365B4B4|nr:ABC transporter permease [Niabella aurantiaca]
MFKNFLTTLIRQLWRSRLFTVLNILGLGVSICIAWIIFRMVSYEYSFDKRIPGAENIYQVITKSRSSDNPEGGNSGISRPIVNVLKNDIAGAALVVPMFYKYRQFATVKEGKGAASRRIEKEEDIQQVATLPDYFKLLDYTWLAGDRNTALDAPDKVVLTEARVKEYFPLRTPQQVIGRRIAYNDTVIYRVSGVVAAPEYPNSFGKDNMEFIRVAPQDLDNNSWDAVNSNDLLFIKPAAGMKPDRLLSQLNAINLKHNRESFEKYHYSRWYEVLPLAEKHFAKRFSAQTRTANKNVLRGLMITGAFLLLLACINYTNLSTALLPKRAKEIGIRKTLGSSARGLILRFMGETLVITLLAALFSFVLTWFAVRIFAGFLPEGLSGYMNYPAMAGFMLVLIGGISLLSGLYPAWLSSRVDTVNVLKGMTDKVIGSNRVPLRKALIVFQFFVAQVFIIGAIIMNRQLQFMLHKDLGFNKNAVITVNVPHRVWEDPAFKDKQFVLKNELNRNTAIGGVALGKRPMDNSMVGWALEYNNGTKEQHVVNIKTGDTDYLRLYQFHLLAGRNFRASDTANEVVINQQTVKAFGFGSPADAIGKFLVSPDNKKKAYPIVGVISDFHQFGLQSAIEPVLIAMDKRQLNTFNIKLPPQPSAWKSAIASVEASWKQVYGSVPFEYRFYDETIKKLYEQEERTQALVRAATGIAVFISCLGLFGLATLTAFQRTKEVGIRKVLGASIPGIVALLSRQFVALVLLSVLIASPVAGWLMKKWLQDFAFRIDIQWWMFALAAVSAVVIALVTVGYQAVKAAAADPVKALRSE